MSDYSKKTKQHRATPEQWAKIEQFAEECGYDACLLELSDRLAAAEQRIQALEGDRTTDLIDSVSAEEIAAAVDDKPQTIHTVALDMVDTLGRSFNVLPVILDTLRRAIRKPMEPKPAPAVEPPELSDEEARELWFDTFNMGAVQTVRRIHRAGWDAAMAAVAVQQPAQPAPAPAGSLVEVVGCVWSYGKPLHPASVRNVIRVVAWWLERQEPAFRGEAASATASIDYFAAWLRKEADR